MVALRVEGGREREHVRGTKLHAKATGLAALDDDGNASFCHESTPAKSNVTPMFNCGGCDYAGKGCWDGVMVITE